MANCWAHPIGQCSAVRSGEHVISKSIFEQKSVNVQGVAWTGGERRQVGKASLVANILCKRHNEQLSELDSVAGDLSSRLRLFLDEGHGGEVEVSGWLYERWCLKTLINLVIARWDGKDSADAPPPELVRIVFGEGKLIHPAGLYIPSLVQGDDVHADHFKYRILSTSDDTRSYLLGLLSSLRNFTTVLAVQNAEIRKRLRDAVDFHGHPLETMKYRPRRCEVTGTHPMKRLVLRLNWPGGREEKFA
jgi:hypothetical protein